MKTNIKNEGIGLLLPKDEKWTLQMLCIKIDFENGKQFFNHNNSYNTSENTCFII